MFSILIAVVLVVAAALPLHAQGNRARVIVTVVDQSGAVVPDATVTLVGLDDATKAAAIAPAKTSDKGIATIENVAPGRYSIQAEFPGFELGLLKDVRLQERRQQARRRAADQEDGNGSDRRP